MHDEFKKAYENLNPSQREAVDAIDGPVMVIAGPGTGKTQILALRIANILRVTDTKPENILALTFTEAGAHAMRARLTRYIGDAAYHVPIHTFHSFAGALIRAYPDAYQRIIGGRIADDIERLSLIQEILDSGHYKLLRPHGDPSYYARLIPKAIADLKKDYVTPDIFAERIASLEENLSREPKLHEAGAHKGKVRTVYLEKEKRVNKLRELLHVYKQYETSLAERRLYDFEDMIVETVKALESHEDMVRDLQETYQYLLADEHQDVNESQNKILDLLASYHEKPNIFVVGDEKQAIYRFQGASLDNFLFFEDRFKGTNIITLTGNYRSTQTILDAAHSLIKTEHDDLKKLRVPLYAKNTPQGRSTACEYRSFAHEAVEDEWVIDMIKRLKEEGVPLHEIAIIARKNNAVEHYATLLRRHGVPVKPSADSDILFHPITRVVEALMRAVVRIDDQKSLFDVLHAGYWNIEVGDLARVFSGRSQSLPLARIISDEKKLQALKIENVKPITRVAEVLQGARREEVTQAPHHVLEYLMRESGLLAHIVRTDPGEGVRVLRRIYDDIEAMVVHKNTTTLSDVVAQFEYRRAHNLPLNAPFIGNDDRAVCVMTAHKSKGLEFDTVLIPRAHDVMWGDVHARDIFKLPLMKHEPLEGYDTEDDERRLFYVAMTRAKRNLFISCAETNHEGKLFEPSRFIGHIDPEKLLIADTGNEAKEFDVVRMFGESPKGLIVEAKLIRELFLGRGFAVTHLNNYLKDPWLYFYRNLLRVPEPRGTSLLFGEAVHEVLEYVVKTWEREKKIATDTDIARLLGNALARLPITTSEYASLHERGFSALVAYIPRLIKTLGPKSYTEMSLSATLKTGDPVMPEIQLTGKLDRVDYDEAGMIARIVDYKTGKPKSENEIRGNTKNSNGEYYRQLVFYALLLQLYDPERKQPIDFTLSYVEPKEKSGEIVEYTFTIPQSDIDALKQEITRVAKEIVTASFFDTPPLDPSVIPYR